MTDPLETRIAHCLGAEVTGSEVIGYGTSGNGTRIVRARLRDGRDVVAKSAEGAFEGLTLEARMLEALAAAGFPVPAVHHADERLLIMDYVPSGGHLDTAAQMRAADAVAALHQTETERFGFDFETVIGALPQPNPWEDDWRTFFAEHRLRRFASCAFDEGRIDRQLLGTIERVADRVPALVPHGTPALIHGDLWGGNVLVGPDGTVRFIDPAIYHGDPEIELAFTTLFGTFGDAFFRRYREHRVIEPGFEERIDLYNLYPLLVHVRLFGGSYVAQLAALARRFT